MEIGRVYNRDPFMRDWQCVTPRPLDQVNISHHRLPSPGWKKPHAIVGTTVF